MPLDVDKAFRNEWLDTILNVPDLPLNWVEISANQNVTLDMIQSRPELPWIMEGLSSNPNLTREYVENHSDGPNYMGWKASRILANPSLGVVDATDIVARALVLHINPPLHIKELLGNPSLTWCFLHEHLTIFLNNIDTPHIKDTSINNILGAISCHPSVTIDVIEKHPEFPWNIEGLSENPNLTPEFVQKHPHFHGMSWNHGKLALHPNFVTYLLDNWRLLDSDNDGKITLYGFFDVTYTTLQECILPIWDWRHLSGYANFTDITRYPMHPWEWDILTLNKNIDIDEILSNLELAWKRDNILRRVDITPEIVLQLGFKLNHTYILGNPKLPTVWFSKHPELPYRHTLRNPNVPFEWYCKYYRKPTYNNPESIDVLIMNPYQKFGSNRLDGFRPLWFAETRRRHMAAFRIHRFWRDVCWNPVYAHARKHIFSYL